MAVFDQQWVASANEVLRNHRTGAVREFAVTLHLAFDDPAHPDCGVAALAGRQQFLPHVGRRADVVARVPYDLAARAFEHDDQTLFMNEVLSSGALWLEGDMAKARFFLRGLVRNASPETVQALRGIGQVAVRRSYLRHVRPADYSYLFGLLVDGPNGARWRFGGATPSPDAFERSLWSGVAAQFVAETPAGRAGHAALFNVMLEAGRGEVALAVGPEHQGRGTLTAGIGLALLHHGFTNWPLARVHARVPGYNIGRLGRLFATGWVEEGRFTDHHFAGGRLWDEHVLVLTRADWEKVEDRYGRFRLPVRPPDDDEVPG